MKYVQIMINQLPVFSFVSAHRSSLEYLKERFERSPFMSTSPDLEEEFTWPHYPELKVIAIDKLAIGLNRQKLKHHLVDLNCKKWIDDSEEFGQKTELKGTDITGYKNKNYKN